MSGDFLDEVGRLFSLVERDVTYKEIEEGGSPAITIGVRTGDTYTLRGDAYYLLEDLSEMIARPGYAAPGLSLEGARTMLIGACSRSLREGNDSATAWLLEKLASTPERWTVIRPVNLTARDTPFVVGGAASSAVFLTGRETRTMNCCARISPPSRSHAMSRHGIETLPSSLRIGSFLSR